MRTGGTFREDGPGRPCAVGLRCHVGAVRPRQAAGRCRRTDRRERINRRERIRCPVVTVVYFDCFSGAAGDMVLGALIDAGVPFDAVRDALGSLALDRDAVRVERVLRAGLRATRLRVRGEDAGFDAAAPAGEPPP
ncbi:MAG: DUF111 family protein, partial [Acidobacteria bacterium]|nr:DUF111 family protein [Acidobacteriota bacterium]